MQEVRRHYPPAAALLDVPRLPSFMPYVNEARELGIEADGSLYVYTRLRLPLVQSRDYVLHVKLEQPPASGRCDISFETVDDPSRPKLDGVVRIPELHGFWSIAPGADGKSLLTYQVFCNPGGGIPPFVAKGGQRGAAIDLVKMILARAHAAGT
jgi:hypothetical protein